MNVETALELVRSNHRGTRDHAAGRITAALK